MVRGAGPAGRSRPGPPRYYPVFLDVRGRTCVVFGDGAVAEAKVGALQDAGAEVIHVPRAYREGDLEGAFLAVEASGNARSQRAARRAADRLGTLLNVLDVPASCDWIAPAVLRRGALQVAVSTAGESPLLAAEIRDRVARDLGAEWGALTALVGGVRRRLKRRGAALDAQRRAQRRLLRSDVRSLLRAGQAAAAEALARDVERAASSPAAPSANGEVVLAGAGPGSAGLLTRDAREALAAADVVLHDALVEPEVLELCGPQTQVVDVGRRSGCRSPSQAEINHLLIAAARQGNLVVRLKGGDPMLLARGGEEIAALAGAGVPVRVIPGISAALAAAGAAGIPLTHRGASASVSIIAGHRTAGRPDRLEAIAAAAETLVVLMPHDLAAIASRIARVVGTCRPAALVVGATTRRQRTVLAPVGEIAAGAHRLQDGAPATLIVGDVVGMFAGAAHHAPDGARYAADGVSAGPQAGRRVSTSRIRTSA